MPFIHTSLPHTRRWVVGITLIIALLLCVLAIVIVRPRSHLVDTTHLEAMVIALPEGMADTALSDAVRPCSQEIYTLHTMISSRMPTWWEDVLLRYTNNCRAFQVVAAKQYNQDRWCVVVGYSYRFFDRWNGAELVVEVGRAAQPDQWVVERQGSWIQPPGQTCP